MIKIIIFFIVILFLNMAFLPSVFNTDEFLVAPIFLCAVFAFSPSFGKGLARAAIFSLLFELAGSLPIGYYLFPVAATAPVFWWTMKSIDFRGNNQEKISLSAILGQSLIIFILVYIFSFIFVWFMFNYDFRESFPAWLLLFQPKILIYNFILATGTVYVFKKIIQT